MPDSLPTVLIPGLFATPRLYAEQLPLLWTHGPVMVADHRRDDGMSAIAARLLAQAPQRFALLGLSMGGYVAFEVMRQAPERVLRLALLDTTARPDTAEQTENRRRQIELARKGRLQQVVDAAFPTLVHDPADTRLRALVQRMGEETGAEAFARQQTAIMHRMDSRPGLAQIRCPTLVLVGEQDQLTPPDRAAEIAAGIRGSRLVQLPQCGHLSTLEQPDPVNAALREWLSG